MNATLPPDTPKQHNGFWHTISTRLGVDHLSYSLPAHAQSLPYMLGGLTFTTFMILFVSGMYIAQFYNPNQISSYQSVLYLISSAPFGNFVRSVHYWASNIVFVLLFAHISRVFITGSYKRPREFTWLVGLGLLALAVLFLFAGTMLSLGQEGIEALEHYNEIGVILGPLGLWFTSGFSSSLPLVGRVYVEHIVILPITFLALITLHFYLIHVHNISPKATKDAVVGYDDSEGTVPFISHIRKLAGWSFILIAIIAILALLFPESLEHVGVAGVPLQEVKPRWMFLWLFGMENAFGIKALIWAPTILFGLLAIVPFIDRSKYVSWRRRPWMMVYGAVIVLTMIVFSFQSMFANIIKKIPENVPLSFIEYVLPGNVAYAHDLVFLSFTPTTVTSGNTITIRAEGLHQTGTYNLYLNGPQQTVSIGSVNVPINSDSFTVTVTIPTETLGALYTLKIANPAKNVTFYAPLQLAVEPISMPTLESYPNDTRYPIPSNEIPWIVVSIILSTGIGIYLLFRKEKVVDTDSSQQ